MKKNIGRFDQTLRLVVGLVIIALGIIYQSWWGLLGLPLLLTGSIRTCPAYIPLGISTKKAEAEEKK
jgi:hypothetical protein